MDSTPPNEKSPRSGRGTEILPTGETQRQAIFSLRGYAYQIIAATLAWLDLDSEAKLFLEVAEDYATVAEQALLATQVKDTAGSGTITLNSRSVGQAIDSFIALSEKNKQFKVKLRYFTTSPIGKESKNAAEFAGDSGLNYWRKAAAGATVEPIRAFLTSNSFSEEVSAFVKQKTDDQLREDLLKKIHWDAGQSDIDGLTRELEERLVVIGRDKFNLPSSESKRLAQPLIYSVLKRSILKNSTERVLSRADLYLLIEAETSFTVSRQSVGEGGLMQLAPLLAAALSGQNNESLFDEKDTSWIVSGSELPSPRAIISRSDLNSSLNRTLHLGGAAFLVGASGLGKSLAARRAAEIRHQKYGVIDFRSLSAAEATRRINSLLGQIGDLDFDCLIFDDLNEIDDPSVRAAFARCLSALKRRDRFAVSTCYRRPSGQTLTELGLGSDSIVEVPYLNEEEALEIVMAAGGQGAHWGKIAFAAGAQGHPQLTHAFVMGLAARNWPNAELREVVVRGFSSDDTDAERDAAKRNIAASLSENTRTLLYRLSLVAGRFDRGLALRISETPQSIPNAGELLDNLIGPWIEVSGNKTFRVSPLASNAGHGMLGVSEQQSIHRAIVDQRLSSKRIDISDASAILTHALLGKYPRGLLAISYSVMTATPSVIDQLKDHFFLLQALQTDKSIYEDDHRVAVMLRMAQFKLVAAKGEGEEIEKCAAALLRDAQAASKSVLNSSFEITALSTILITIGIGSWLRNWVSLLQRFKLLIQSDTELFRDFSGRFSSTSNAEMTLLGGLFAVGSSSLRSVKRLEEIAIDLDKLSKEDRSVWLELYSKRANDYSILVQSAWASEHFRNELDATDAEERFERLSKIALKWDDRELVLQCYVARSVMLDEYMNDEDGAHALIDEATRMLGDSIALQRTRVKLYWRHNKFADAVSIMRSIAAVVGGDSAVDRAFALRQGAISAYNVEDWDCAIEWFSAAYKAADSVQDLGDMKVMSVGLRADCACAHANAGNVLDALRLMGEAIAGLEKIDADGSLMEAACHRLVRHAVLWLNSKIAQEPALIDGRPIVMIAGSCSNMDPPHKIKDLPLGPLDMAWYLLAEAEIIAGVDAGIEKGLQAKLSDAPIIFLEFKNCIRRISQCIFKSDSKSLASNLMYYLSWAALFRSTAPAQRNSDPLRPIRGKVSLLSKMISGRTMLRS